MKDFKRKLAKLFGLALRSDFHLIHEAYEKKDNEVKKYYADIIILTHPDSYGFATVQETTFRYRYKRVSECSMWQGNAIKAHYND